MPKTKERLWDTTLQPVADFLQVGTIHENNAVGPYGWRPDPRKDSNLFIVTVYVAADEHEVIAASPDKRIAAAICAMLNQAHNRLGTP